MGDTNMDIPLTLADLQRVRIDLQVSIRHTEEMLQRTESLLLAAALLEHGVAIRLLTLDDPLHLPPQNVGALDAGRLSTN